MQKLGYLLFTSHLGISADLTTPRTLIEHELTTGLRVKGLRDPLFKTDPPVSGQDFLKNLHGYEQPFYNGTTFGSVDVYRGIPYANDISKNRFQKPVLFDGSWEGVKDCTEPAPVCYQDLSAFYKYDSGVEHSENCLTLDIYKL